MKHRLSITGFNLGVLENRVRVRLGPIAAAVLGAARVSGTFGNDLAVRRFVAGVGAVDFATPRTLGDGQAVALSSADLEACEAVEIAVVTGETGIVDLVLEVESESAPEIMP